MADGKKVEFLDVGVYYPVTITDGNGTSQTVMAPLAGGKVYAYDVNTTNAQTVYSDVGTSAALAQPFTLDSNGRLEVFIDSKTVKFVIKDSTEATTIRTMDYIDGQRAEFQDNVTFNGTVTFASSFGFSDGTVASPGLQFSGDTNTGFRRIGADNMSAVAGGVDIIDIDGSGIEMKKRIETIDGTAAAPAVVIASDLDTGIYSTAANQLGFSCAGTLVFEATGTGVILDQPLKVQDGTVSAPTIGFESDADNGLYHSGTANTWRASAGGTEVAEFTSSGVNFPEGIDPGDNGTYLKMKVVATGDWNMNSTASITVAHGLTAANIRSVTGYVRNDAADTYYAISGGNVASTTDDNDVYIGSWDSTNITVQRDEGGTMVSTDFDATTYNRGHLTIIYVA